ncbi:MAG: hypothetical protein HY362_02465 [Candidatus Aenigmarchaeota archaeon]|nr:hypothetical protein [Candidatus Aenigmarchaeota archaeon]
MYRKVIISAVFALVFLGFFAQFAAAEVIEKGTGVDTYSVQAPSYSAVLRDWYSEGDYVYHYSAPDGSSFSHREVRGELAGSNNYGNGYNIFYYVLVYPNGTEKVLYEQRINTADATSSDYVKMTPEWIPEYRYHYTSKIDITAMNLTADISDYGHYKVELRRVEIPKIMLSKNPMENYNLEDKLDKWRAETINTMYYSSSWNNGDWWREYRDENCAAEGPVGNITLKTAVTVNRYGPINYPTTSCGNYNMNPASGYVCKYNYYEYTENDRYGSYVNHARTDKCWIERNNFEKIKVKDLQVGVIWTHEFDVKQPLTITAVKACGDIECKTNPAFRPAEDAFFFINTSEPAGLIMNVWKTQTAEETKEKYSYLKLGAEVKGDTSFMKITNDGIGYRKIITTDKFSYPLKIKWKGKYAFYQAGMVNMVYGDQEDFSMGHNNGNFIGFYLGTFDSGAMNTNYVGNVNLGQPEVNKEHTYELQVLKDKLVWFLDGNKINEVALSNPLPASRIGIIAYGGSVEFQLKEFQIDLGDGQITGNINGGDKFLNFTASNQAAVDKYSSYTFSIISEPEWGKPYILQNGKLKLSGGTNFPAQPSPESRYDRHGCGGDPNGCGWYSSSATFKTQDKFGYPVKIKWKGTIEAGYSELNYNNIQMMYRTKENFPMNNFLGFFWDGWYRRLYAVSDVIPVGQQWPPSVFLGDLSGTEHTFELDVYKDKVVWLLDGNKVMEQALSQPPEPGSAEVRALGELRVSFLLSELTVDKGDLVLKSDFSNPELLQPAYGDNTYLVGMRPQGPMDMNAYISNMLSKNRTPPKYTLLANWSFDGNFIDSIGERNGNLIGTVLYSAMGNIAFGGSEKMDVPNVINGLGNFEINTYFTYNKQANWQWIYGNGPDLTDVGVAITAGGDILRYHMTTENSAFYDGNGITQLVPGKVYHLRYVYDGNVVAGYIDGKLDFSRQITGKVKTSRQQAIGAGTWNKNEYYIGTISDFRIIVNNTAVFTGGFSGQAASFDGKQRIEVPNILNGLSGFKIEAWFKVDDFGTWRWIYGSGPDWTDVGVAATAGGNTLRYHLTTENGQFYNGGGQNIVSNGEWHKMEYVYDGVYARGYVDGKLDFERPMTGKVKTNRQQAIGAGFWNNNEYFKGAIDEVRIYKAETDIESLNIPKLSSTTYPFLFSPQEEGDYTLEFVARADERNDTFSQPIFVSYDNGDTGVAENFISNPFIQDSGGGGTGNENAGAAGGAAIPLAAGAVLAAGAGGIVLLSRSPRTGKVITGIKEGFTDYGNNLLKRSKEILDFIQEEKNGYWVKLWEARMRAEAAMWAQFNAAQAEKQKAQWLEENKQTIWAANQAQEAIDMLKSGKGDPGWFVERMQYLSENSDNKELSAQLAGLGMQIQSQLEARPAVVYTPELGKPAAPLVSAPAKAEPKGILDNVMGFFGNVLGNAKKLVGGVLDTVGKIPLIGQPIINAVNSARDFVVDKSEEIKKSADAMGLIGIGLIAAGVVLTPVGGIGIPILAAGIGLGAVSSAADLAVYGAKESVGRADEDDTTRAMFAPLGLIGGGVGSKGAKELLKGSGLTKSILKQITKSYGVEVARVVEQTVKISGRKFGKEEIEDITKVSKKLLESRDSTGKLMEGREAVSKYLATKDVPITNTMDLVIEPKAGPKLLDYGIPGEVIEHTKIGTPAEYRDITWRLRNKSEQLKYVKDKTRTVLIEIEEKSKFDLDDAKDMLEDLKTADSFGWENIDKIVVVKGNNLMELGVDLKTSNTLSTFTKLETDFAKMTLNLGGLFTTHHELAKMVLANEEGKRRYGGIIEDMDNAVNAILDRSVFAFGEAAVGVIRRDKPLSSLNKEDFEVLQEAVRKQEKNFGFSPNKIVVGDVEKGTFAQANFDTIRIGSSTPIVPRVIDFVFAHEMGHVFIAKNRFEGNLGFYMEKFEHGSKTWFNELEADALVRVKAGDKVFKDMVNYRVADITDALNENIDRQFSATQIESIISAELLAKRTGDSRLANQAHIPIKALINKGKVSEADYNEAKDIMDNWLTNTIDKGKVGSEAEAGEVQDQLMDILPR